MDNIISKDQNKITTDTKTLVFVAVSHSEDVCALCDVMGDMTFKSCAGIPCCKSERADKKHGYFKYQ